MADITIEYSFALVVQLIHDLLPDDSALHWVLLPIHDLLIGPYYGIGFSIPSLEWGSLSEAPAGLVALSLLVLLSPLFFMVSALCVGYSMYTKGTVPKGIGEVHLIYFFSILIILVGSSSYDYLFGEFFYSLGIFISGPSLSGAFIGFGFWVGGLAGFGFIYRPPPLSPPDVVSSNAVYQHYLRQLIAQGYDEATAKKYAKEYEENHTKQQ